MSFILTFVKQFIFVSNHIHSPTLFLKIVETLLLEHFFRENKFSCLLIDWEGSLVSQNYFS